MNGISLIKFFATVLITNSHFATLYPAEFQNIATGGTIGNSLFFFVSGYGLYFSDKSNFIKWITKRYLRILIPYWIFLAIRPFLGYPFAVLDLIFPSYWFLSAILIFYLLYFIVTKIGVEKLWISFVCVSIAYLILFFSFKHNSWIIELTDNHTKLHWFYYFLIMILGALFAHKNINIKNTNSIFKLLIIIIIYLSVYYGFKYLIISNQLYNFQFLVPVPLFFICWHGLEFAEKLSTIIPVQVSAIIQFISNLTLEIYIVQFIIINCLSHSESGFKAIIAIVLIVLCAYLLNLVSKKINYVLLKSVVN